MNNDPNIPNPNNLMQRMFESVLVEKFVREVWEVASPEVKKAFADALVKSATEGAGRLFSDFGGGVGSLFAVVRESPAWKEAEVKALAVASDALTVGWDRLAAKIQQAVERVLVPEAYGNHPLRSLAADIGEYARKKAATLLGVP